MRGSDVFDAKNLTHVQQKKTCDYRYDIHVVVGMVGLAGLYTPKPGKKTDQVDVFVFFWG
jgi:hypothetical protein